MPRHHLQRHALGLNIVTVRRCVLRVRLTPWGAQQQTRARTVTLRTPILARWYAAEHPAMPAPQMTTSALRSAAAAAAAIPALSLMRRQAAFNQAASGGMIIISWSPGMAQAGKLSLRFSLIAKTPHSVPVIRVQLFEEDASFERGKCARSTSFVAAFKELPPTHNTKPLRARHCFLKLRRPIGSSDLHRKSF